MVFDCLIGRQLLELRRVVASAPEGKLVLDHLSVIVSMDGDFLLNVDDHEVRLDPFDADNLGGAVGDGFEDCSLHMVSIPDLLDRQGMLVQEVVHVFATRRHAVADGPTNLLGAVLRGRDHVQLAFRTDTDELVIEHPESFFNYVLRVCGQWPSVCVVSSKAPGLTANHPDAARS